MKWRYEYDDINTIKKGKKNTQKEIVDFLKTTQTTYARYENGTRQPDIETLCKLADYFNVSVDYLLSHSLKEQEKTPVFQRKTEIQAYFDELTPYEQGEVIGYIKRMLYNKGVDTQMIIEGEFQSVHIIPKILFFQLSSVKKISAEELFRRVFFTFVSMRGRLCYTVLCLLSDFPPSKADERSEAQAAQVLFSS